MRKNKVLIIGAHPADPIDLAGGTAYQMQKDNSDVIAIHLTSGAYSHSTSLKETNIAYIKDIKKQEFINACSVLDITPGTFSSDYVDEPLIVNEFRVRYLAGYIRLIKPDIVITHSPNEYAHWDHSACGEIVVRALKAAIKLPPSETECFFKDSDNNPWYVPTIYFFAVQFRPEVARLGAVPQPPDVLIDIEGGRGIFKKIEAMACFESQGITIESMENRVQSFEGEMGRADGLEYAEGFSLFYPLKRKTLPFNEDKGFYGGGK